MGMRLGLSAAVPVVVGLKVLIVVTIKATISSSLRLDIGPVGPVSFFVA